MDTITKKPEGGGSFRIGGDEDSDAGQMTVVNPATEPSPLNRGIPITDAAHPENQPASPPPLPASGGNHSDEE